MTLIGSSGGDCLETIQHLSELRSIGMKLHACTQLRARFIIATHLDERERMTQLRVRRAWFDLVHLSVLNQ